MGRSRAALYGLACAFVAAATPAAAFFGNDPWNTGSIYVSNYPYRSGYAYGSPYGYGSGIQSQDALRAQAVPIPRQVVEFRGRFAPGTIVVSTEERRLYTCSATARHPVRRRRRTAPASRGPARGRSP